jgi:hypothetical protein
MTLKQLTYCNVHLFVTAIAYNTCLTLLKVQVPVVHVVEVQLRDVEVVEVQVPVDVQLTVTMPKKWNHKYKSKKPQKKLQKKQSQKRTALITENTNLNNLGRRDLPKSQFRQEFLIRFTRPPNAYNNRTHIYDKRMQILNRRTSLVGAAHKCVIICTGKIIAFKRRPPAFVTSSSKRRFITRRKRHQANPKDILNSTSLIHLPRHNTF